MQFPESWLREFCNPALTTQELADTLTMAGLEVEDLVSVAPAFSGVVVGEIKSAEQHPNADRLRVCQVDVGDEVLLNIVCGAPNARVGLRVPCARVGAQLPPTEDGKPFSIKLGKLRGIESQGMLCSAKELGIDDDASGLLELESDAPLGLDIRTHLGLDDTLFTLKLTPNLAHALSVYGVARELSALTGAPLKVPSFPVHPTTLNDHLPVKIEAPDLCGRFSGRVVRGVNAKAKTPRWMVDRLKRCGQRSVSALVDISNYVMFELGRPSHMFDLDKIEGSLYVRWAREGETLKLLNGQTVNLDPQVGVISDDRQVESLAGIMGGDATAVSDDTCNVYMEAAFWFPKSIAGRSRRFNFSTDAGHRFERGVDPEQTVEHLERISELLLSICGGQLAPIHDAQVNLPSSQPVTLRVARAEKVIGMPLTQAVCAQSLRRLGLAVQEGEGVLTVQPPSYRFDLQIEEDLIEEVARLIGFQALPTSKPLAPVVPKLRAESSRSPYAVRRALAGMGYQETINFSFVDERWERELSTQAQPIRLLNPIASQMNVMRSNLLGSLLQAAKFNIDRRAHAVRIFEVGAVFLRAPEVQGDDSNVTGFKQPLHLGGLAWGDHHVPQWGIPSRSVDFFDVKGDVEALLVGHGLTFEKFEHPALHPGRSAKIKVGSEVVGFVGELHPRWKQSWDFPSAPVLFELDMAAVLRNRIPSFQPVPKHQAVERDLAVIVTEDLSYAQLMEGIWTANHEGLLQDAVLFDVFRHTKGKSAESTATWLGNHEKSLAVKLIMRSEDSNLTEAQIERVVAAVLSSLSSRTGARLRA